MAAQAFNKDAFENHHLFCVWEPTRQEERERERERERILVPYLTLCLLELTMRAVVV
jgi:hypothetical protein